MVSLGICELCTRLFTNPNTVDVMRDHRYTWSRGLNELITLAESGCAFCSLLQRSFSLRKYAHIEVNHGIGKPENYSEALVTFSLQWYIDSWEDKISSLEVVATNLEDESSLVDWGVDGHLFPRSPLVSFEVMTLRGAVVRIPRFWNLPNRRVMVR